ncbi:hypothetical protein INR49_023216 [Caranx melampygus]|nr:hypothetical protein INR49_023216 [Caranx melampygus]
MSSDRVWRCYEVHDIVIECSRVSLDPLEASCEEDLYSSLRETPLLLLLLLTQTPRLSSPSPSWTSPPAPTAPSPSAAQVTSQNQNQTQTETVFTE